jgi:hypothetical protein
MASPPYGALPELWMAKELATLKKRQPEKA